MRSAARLRLLSSVLTVSLISGLVAVLPSSPASAAEPGLVADRSVPVSAARPGGVAEQVMPKFTGTPAVWPVAGSATVDLPLAADQRSRAAANAAPGGLPLRVEAVEPAVDDLSGATIADMATASDLPSKVSLDVLGRAQLASTGAHVAVAVRAAAGSRGGRVQVQLDYSKFRSAFGGDWAWRLKLAVLPTCLRETVVPEGCAAIPLASVNNPGAGTISAEIDLLDSTAKSADSQPMTIGLMSVGSSTESGDFTKTDLKESGSWTAGTSAGDFNWSYPIASPPVPSNLVPPVTVAYSSAAVDGQTAGQNTQPGPLGEGWTYAPSFVERTYRTCADDTANSPYWTALNLTGDLCWRLPNAQVTLNGVTSEIVLGDDGTWRLENDNGEKVELLLSAPNNDGDGEHWKITTTDGTQYWFGKQAMPNGKTGTNSVMTAPVFANHAGEPCFTTVSVLTSRCTQGVRWMLDYVVDRNGNEISYWYSRTTNKTSLAGSSSSTTSYYRDINLYRIEYGTHTSDAAAVSAPARVMFSYGDRCFTAACGIHDEANWPDTSWDLQCDVSPCGNNMSPSFWTNKRLQQIYTQVLVSGAYSNVDTWNFDQEFPATGDGSSPTLWLKSITHVGNGGPKTDVTLPAVKFWGVRMQNRADYDPNAGMRSHNKRRVYRVLTEAGAQTDVTYAADDAGCQFGSAFPDPDNNASRCFPQLYTNDSGQTGWSWWHKRVVSKVVTTDATAGSPEPLTYDYTYANTATDTSVLWAHSNGARVWGSSTPLRSWSDWRGYTNVTIVSGPAAGPKTQTEYVYFRGMHGDRTDSGTRTVGLAPYSGTWSDQAQRRGHLVNTYVYDQAGGTIEQIMQYDPWTQTTGTRTLADTWAIPGTFYSKINRTSQTRRWEKQPDGTMSWRTSVVDTFSPTVGRLVTRWDKRNAASGDDTCTRYDYADDVAKNFMAFPSRETTVTGTCADAYTIPESLVFDHAWRYDGQGYDVIGAYGNVSRDYVWRDNGGWIDRADNVAYDKYGRVTSTEDGLGNVTTTAYTQNTDLLTSSVKVTNPKTHETVITFDVRTGLPETITDANGKITTGVYDALGRLLSVKKPGNTTTYPDVAYAYNISQTTRPWVETKTLGANGNQIVSYEIFDGLLRLRQTQTPSHDGKRVIEDTRYNEHGKVRQTSTFYNAGAAPASDLLTFADADVPTQTRYTFDGRARQITAKQYENDALKWTTTTIFGWNSIATLPPAGGTTSQQFFDDLGNLTEKRQFHTADIGGTYDKTLYTYNQRSELTSHTDADNNSWVYEYNLLGWKTKETDPDTGVTTATYDANGNLKTTFDARGTTLTYNYDSLNRRTSIYQGTTKLSSWDYDTVAKGQPYGSYQWEGTSAYAIKNLELDDAYRPTKVRTTIPNTAENTGLGGDYDTATTYKPDGSPATMALPAVGGLPGETLTYTYGSRSLLSALTGQTTGGQATTYINAAHYNYDQLLTQLDLGESGQRARREYGYEAGTRRLSVAYTRTEDPATPGTFGTSKMASTYSYDNAGNITSIAGTTDGVADSEECFQYDHLRRLKTAWTQTSGTCATPQKTGADPYWRTWTFDATGNRQSQIEKNADGTTGTSWTYNNGTSYSVKPHQVKTVTANGPLAGTATRTFGYDAAGNMTSRTTETGAAQTLDYDLQGRMTTVKEGTTTVESHLYDADGNRLITRTPSKNTLYLPDGTEIEKYNSGGNILAQRYIGGIALKDITGITWLISNHQNTDVAQIKASDLTITRRRAMPYGETRGTQPTWTGTKGYVNGTQDPTTGLTHLGARDYDPTLGRFTSRDPIIDLAKPQQWHGYAYSDNTPVTTSDPSGLHNGDTDMGGGGGAPPVKCGDPGFIGPCAPTTTPTTTPTPTTPTTTPTPTTDNNTEDDPGKNEALLTASEVVSAVGTLVGFAPAWLCTPCSFIGVALAVIEAILKWIGGDRAAALGALLGGALGILFGSWGNRIAKRLSNEVTPTLLYEIGIKAWEFVESTTKNVLQYFPTTIARRIAGYVSEGTTAVANILSSFLGTKFEEALKSS